VSAPRLLRRAAPALALALCATPPARAQTSVAGTLRLHERDDADRGDRRTAVVYLEPRGATARAADDVPALRSASIAMRGREFIPHVRVIRAGGTVSFPNQDPFSHNVFSSVEHREFDLGLYRRGVTRSATFAHPGVHPIYCNIHSKMVSFVVAVPGPWFAQPDAEGRFAMRDVPPGSYRLHAWHERGAGEYVREIVVPSGGLRDLDVTIDARAYVSSPHMNKFGLPYAVIRTDRY
jgi:plastocyanin